MCIFCAIANKEIPANIVYEDEDIIAFLDLSQAGKGHTLVVPKKHYKNVLEIDEKDYCKAMKVARKIAIALEKTYHCDINILNNCGINAGQTVFHFHIHVIPRLENDTVTIKWVENSLKTEEFEAIKKAIISNL